MILFNKRLKKGKIKWIYDVCLYSLALVFLPAVLSFCFITEKTSALLYDVTEIPLYSDTVFVDGSGIENDDFSIRSSTFSEFSDFKFNSNGYFSYTPTFDGSRCVYFSGPHQQADYSGSGPFSSYFVGISSFQYFDSEIYSDVLSRARCSLGPRAGFGDSFVPSFPSSNDLVSPVPSLDSSTIPTAVHLRLGSSLGNYYFPFSTFAVSDSTTSADGVVYTSKLMASSIFTSIPSRVYRLTIPYGFADSSKIGSFSEGRSFELRGAISLSSDSTSNFSLDSSFTAKVLFHGLALPDSISQLSFNCSSVRFSVLQDQSLLSYVCPFTLPSDFDFMSFSVELETSSSDFYLFDTASDWGWSGVAVVTDGDPTPSGVSYSDPCVGSACSSRPGSVSSPSSDSADWFSSLTNLFSFSVFNPFAPIFNLFTDGQSCARIPIIAGMLHAESDEYCSWFPSSVRNVLTPVFSLASVMLLFGFIVRWLGSSSGNFFEDSKSEEVSNQGGRWGRFKRGGK